MKRFLSLLLAMVLVLTLLPGLPMKAEARTGGKLIALTFDDGPSSKYTNQLLDGLKERGVPVTFFLLGEMAKSNRAIVRRAYEEGHEIACHTWSHPNLTKCTKAEIQKELEDTFEELDRACGDEADYLVRPPYGSTNEKVRSYINVPIINWSVDSEDWSLLNTEKVRKKIVADAYDGAIILCHDIHKTTIPAALGAIDDLMDKGYEFVTVSELFRRRGRSLELHKTHYNSNKNGIDYGPIPAPKISFTGDPQGNNTVTLSCAGSSTPIYYTLDGSYPDQNAALYTGPFTVPFGTTVTAVAAWKLNGSRSPLTVKCADQIEIVPPTITMDDSGRVVMSTPTVNSEIFFTIDDTVPTADSLRYTGPEPIGMGCFLRAVTVHKRGVSADTRVYFSDSGCLYYDMYEGQWFFEAMDWAHTAGILNGTGPYTMDPAGTVTRGMMVTLLYRFSGDTLGEGWERTNQFADVNQNFYYAEAIEWAFRNKIVDGYSPEAFGPDDVVTRQQMCKIVASYLAWNETPLHEAESCEGDFADYGLLAPWALESVDGMVAAGLIQGSDGLLNPNNGTNRAQFCVVLTRLVDYIDNYVPMEPDHVHEWKMNLAQHGCVTWCSATIDEGETIDLFIECSVCGEIPPVEWSADPDGVVLVEENRVTGILGGNSVLISALWEEISFECMIYVRSADEIPTDPSEPTEPTEPTEPEPTEPDPTEPTEPEPTEPVHVHSWKLNKARGEDPAWGEVSIDVGETFKLRIICTGVGCKEEPEVEWVAEPDGVVLVEDNVITGLLSGKNARVRATWEGVEYECLIHVRKDDTQPTEPEPTDPEPTVPSEPTEPTEPEPTEPSEPTDPEPSEPEHVHDWKLNKALSGSETTGDVSIRVGEWFTLRILCKGKDCKENAPIEWTPSREGVVSIEGMRITGVKAGSNTTLSAEWEGETYSCIIRVRKQTNSAPGLIVRE